MANRFNIEAIFTGVDALSPKFRTIGAKLDGFVTTANKRFDALNAKASAAFGGLGKAATLASTGLTIAGGKALADGMGFDQAIANVGAVSLMTREQVADLEEAARKLGRTGKYSATEVAQGMELMGKAGFDNAQILAGIPDFLNAAAAEGAAFEETASTMSNVLKGMGLDMSQTGRVADVLTLASARTNSSITSLGESMKNVSPVARQFGVRFEDAVSAVALLQDVGLDASEAGTATATMLTKLAKPTDDVRARMAALGVKFQDAHGNMLPLPGVLAEMAKAANKSGGNMKTVAFFADLVGLRGQKAALNLQELFKSGKFNSLSAELDDAAGKAKQMADLRMETLTGDITKLKGAALDLEIALFDTQSGPLRDLVQDFTKWLNSNQAEIIHGIGDAIQWVRANGEDLVKWGTRFAEVALAFYAIDKSVKVAALGIEAFGLGKDVVLGVGKAALWSAGRMGMFNATVADNVAKMNMGSLASLRMGANYSKLGVAINGVNSPLGKLGLLGAAAVAGLAVGTLINDWLGLDKVITDALMKLKDAKSLGNRGTADGSETGSNTQGSALDANEQHLADGTVLRADGSVKVKGKDWQRHEMRYIQKKRGVAPGAGMPAYGSTSPLDADAARRAMPLLMPGEVPSPTAAIARQITESTTTHREQVEIKVSTDRGTKAEVTKKPPRRSPVAVTPSGAL